MTSSSNRFGQWLEATMQSRVMADELARLPRPDAIKVFEALAPGLDE